jgi:hypothetical protein
LPDATDGLLDTPLECSLRLGESPTFAPELAP